MIRAMVSLGSRHNLEFVDTDTGEIVSEIDEVLAAELSLEQVDRVRRVIERLNPSKPQPPPPQIQINVTGSPSGPPKSFDWKEWMNRERRHHSQIDYTSHPVE